MVASVTSATRPSTGERAESGRGPSRQHAGSVGSRRSAAAEGGRRALAAAAVTVATVKRRPQVRMRRSPRPGSTASPHKHTPNFYSDNSNSSVSVTSGDTSGHRSAGPGPGEPEGRRARGSSCGEPALSAGVPGGATWEVCSIRFLLTAASLLSLFLAALWWGLLYLAPPLENEPKEMLTLSEYHERVRSQGQQLQQLQAELDKLHKEVSSVRAANSERVAKLVFQRLNEDFVRKPDYALSSVGASIDLEKTSHDYEDTNTAYFWNRFNFWNYARPPTVILEPDVFPGNCWAFEGHQGQVVIRLPGRVQLSDITLQHPPPSVAHTEGANSAPRDFKVFGLQVDDETEVFLGKFTFDVEKSEIQTFHLQNDPPAAFPKVKIQILSNWGHPRFTCLYRVRAHGVRTSEVAEDSATRATGGSH
ncbi:Sperm-associated antigen 4 protein [Tupaia chinensis]|uniref:Sperm-associated antigen 4 protein n=1 Tax=Tupaia chinensis TaxID=246437 RepID=L9L4D2_TUPCH|nr:Sperm-associated antigen 4 protein [Tupaia chinensis]